MKTLSVQKLVTPLVLMLVLFSCKSEITTSNLKQIETLQFKVDSSNLVYKKLNIEEITKNKLYAEKQLDFLKEHNHDTTLALNKFMDVYYGNFKIMRKYLTGYKRLGSEIDFSTSQLTHLYNDVENGFAHDSSYTKHFEDEKLAVSKIVNTCATLLDWEQRSTKRYNGMVQPIDSIITELQKQGYR